MKVMVFWSVVECSLWVEVNRSSLFQNTGACPPDNLASHSRRLFSVSEFVTDIDGTVCFTLQAEHFEYPVSKNQK
jgi:hypothetical protein